MRLPVFSEPSCAMELCAFSRPPVDSRFKPSRTSFSSSITTAVAGGNFALTSFAGKARAQKRRGMQQGSVGAIMGQYTGASNYGFWFQVMLIFGF